MREILFRGKRTDNGECVYGYYVHIGPASCQRAYIIPEYASALYAIEVDPDTVGQCTGLTDKNGKKIFEDDIFHDEQSGYNYYIKWFPEYACFALANKNGHIEFGCDELKIFLDDLVVIGNIHDNLVKEIMDNDLKEE